MAHVELQKPLGLKSQASWNLDHVLQGTELDFFVLLSSVAGIGGSRSQSNHNAANAFEDTLARLRVSEGLPGASIDLGVVVSASSTLGIRSIITDETSCSHL
ncbi:KR domain-containing protein [Aspergillus pseudoustus]|uniref:KR domain-containing protein n=1 Tax=Aspergillus pseudoustus TaxID=1810923 RepID=A0ABR4IUC9_9EURO